MIRTVKLSKGDAISLKNCVVIPEEDYLKLLTREELANEFESIKRINTKKGYLQGIEEVWDCLQDVVQLDSDDARKLFRSVNFSDILFDYSAPKVMQVMKEYNEKKTNKLKENVDDFKIGDIVYAPGYSRPVVVIVVDDTQVRVMNYLGDNSWVSKCEVKKTGDYLAQVAHIFSLIKGVADK